MMTDEGFKMLFDIIEGQSGSTLSEKQKLSFQLLLKPFDDSMVLKRAGQFFLSPDAGMRRGKIPVAGDLIEQPQAKADAAALAWATVRRAIGEVGSYRSVEFEDGAITATVEAMGGWLELCSKTSKEMDMLAWQFVKIYPSFAGKCDRKALLGRHDLANRANGQTKELEPARVIPTLGTAPSLPQLEGEI